MKQAEIKSTRQEGMSCVNCGKPIRKGASIETMSWTQYQGLVTDKDGRKGWAIGPSIMISYHARCSKHFQGLDGHKRLLGAIDRHLRNKRASKLVSRPKGGA